VDWVTIISVVLDFLWQSGNLVVAETSPGGEVRLFELCYTGKRLLRRFSRDAGWTHAVMIAARHEVIISVFD
jgi:hypothetical protein